MTTFIIIFSISLLLGIVVAWNYKKKIITRNDGVPYLIRHTLFDCGLFSIKIHKILLSDDACLHDHPWSFISFIFWRGYTEESYRFLGSPVPNSKINFEEFRMNGIHSGLLKEYIVTKKYKAPTMLWRSANYTHRLVVDKPAYSFVITFKKVRQWGFWTPTGWKAWFTYKQQDSCN